MIDGQFNSSTCYTLEELSRILGIKDRKNLRYKLRHDWKVQPAIIAGRNIYSGKLLVEAVERLSTETSD